MLNLKNVIQLTNQLYAFAIQFEKLAQKTSVMPDKAQASKQYTEYAEMAKKAIAYITMMEAYEKNAEYHALQNEVLMEALIEKQKKLNRYEALEDLIANDELEKHVDRVKELFKTMKSKG